MHSLGGSGCSLLPFPVPTHVIACDLVSRRAVRRNVAACIVSRGQTLSGIAQAHRERVWELAQVLSCNIRGNAGLGVL